MNAQKTLLTVGTRVFNRGDMANPEHFGTITQVILDPKWGNSYEITPDADSDRGPYTIHVNMVSPVDKGHGGTRIVTEAAYRAYRAECIAAYARR